MTPAHSPYEVPVHSVAVVPDLKDQPLQPFERDQLKYLINQVRAASPRVQQALVREVFP